MREIKFRAWDKEFKQFSDMALNYKIADINYYTDYEWMQYTGLKDKNGKEIYEGDILDDPEEKPLYVEFSTKFAAFCFVDKFDPCGPTFYTTKDLHYEDLKVIGNIYENPELLEN
ncbi:YopX family protein [Bacillus cereus]|uniref:YopX family protein n=1 Tax=Bacillus TaxID=1386 RepID=UPI0024B9A050|nr:YopX family protein [Bacillus cereus]WHS74866.1 YopX family protein [Bacillus cereus]